MTHTGVSHQAKAQEDYLQPRLFTRLTRSIELTADATVFYLDAKKALDTVDAATALFSEFAKRALEDFRAK